MDTTLPSHHHHFRTALTLSAVVVVLGGVGLWIYYANRPKPTTNSSTHRVAETIGVPQLFQDFVGTVVAVNGSDVQATFRLTNSAGGNSVRTYLIHTSAATALKTQTTNGTAAPIMSALQLSQLKAGDKIHAFAATNLYPVSEFSATKLYLIH